MPVLMIFFDGLGLGPDNPATNPLVTTPLPTWRALFDNALPTLSNVPLAGSHATVVPTDATLGIPGLPQSATGQTTILTGINAARVIGEHSGPYPNPALRRILSEGNLFQWLTAAGRRVAFANAYPPVFFERLARNKARRSAISFAAGTADIRYGTADDLRIGRAVSAFVTNARWPQARPSVDPPSPEQTADVDPPSRLDKVPIITARDAGRNLARIAADHDFTLFEYFLSDAAGHKGDPVFTRLVLHEMDQLLCGVLDEMDLANSLILITSDHGNLEDRSAKGHTLNPVPTLLIGAGHAQVAATIHSLTDITPAILDYFL
jgi:2,3-bisphosphoglycerate-independent phosphoglycerate mutase